MESKITILEIFQDHWETFTKEYPGDMIRPVVHLEVQKVISCGDPSGGFAMYCRPHCGAYKDRPVQMPFPFLQYLRRCLSVPKSRGHIFQTL